jgi:hypothetical protein
VTPRRLINQQAAIPFAGRPQQHNMLILLSPAKTLDFETQPQTRIKTTPELLDDGAELAAVLKQFSPKQIAALMGVNDKLAELNYNRFQDWEAPPPEDATKQAVLAFKGEVYRGLLADEMTEKQLLYAQDHLRILSGLYGVLRPLDAILPYRLEMGTRLNNPRGKDLYAFWGDRIGEAIGAQLRSTKSKYLLNLASAEYFRSVNEHAIETPIVAPVFKDKTKGGYRVVTVYAKKARGTMAAWVIRNKAKTLKKLLQFDDDGYRYDAESSSEHQPVFLRG